MFNPNPSSGVLARRFRLQRAPLGTPQRVLNLRFRRALRCYRWQPRCGPYIPARTYATDMFPPEEITKRLARGLTTPYLPPWVKVEPRRFIDKLFLAIRAKDPLKAIELIMDIESEADRKELIHLPTTQFTEVMQSLDPTRIRAQVDLLDEVRITPAMMGHPFTEGMVDKNGVRTIYLDLLSHLAPIVDARIHAKIPTSLAVFTVMFRLVGACSNADGAVEVLAMLTESEDFDLNYKSALRNYNMLNEFLKVRFLTEPLYYQYDKERVRVRPRNMHGHLITYPREKVMALDRLRLSLRANQGHSFRVEPDWIFKDLSKTICSSRLIRRVMPVSRFLEVGVSEELLCTAFVASCRTGSSHYVRTLLVMFYGIKASIDRASGEITVTGGKNFPEDSPIRPTERLLMAIARGLGTSGELDLAIEVIVFISRRYNIPVTRDIWSEWLGWAYVHGSKPAKTEWKIVNDARRMHAPRQIHEFINQLSQGSHGFQPDFEDLSIIARTLITTDRLPDAVKTIRRARQEYEKLALDYEKAAIREAAFRAADIELGPRTSPAVQKRRDAALFTLQNLCREWLEAAGKMTRYKREVARDLRVAGVLIPDFVAEFAKVLPQRITYDIPGGEVCMHLPTPTVLLSSRVVESPPAMLNVRVPTPLIMEGEYVGESGESGESSESNERSESSERRESSEDGYEDGYEDEDEGDVPLTWASEKIIVQHSGERTVRFPLRDRATKDDKSWELDYCVVHADPTTGVVSVGDRPKSK